MQKIFILFFSAIIIFSCSKNETPIKKKNPYNFPIFENIETAFNEENQNHHSEIKEKLNLYYQSIWGNEMSGGFLVAQNGEILFEKYKGFGREEEQMPINAETPLHIASISKPITAMAIMKLVEHQKLDLNQEINTILPNFPYEKINIFHLLTHRSGLPKYEHFLEHAKQKPQNGSFFTNQEILEFLIEQKPALSKETDAGFMYNNLNYALLGLVVEKITGKDFPTAMEAMIFEPLGMKNTFIFQEKDIETASQSFYRNGKLFPLNEYDLIYGDKNVYTTPRDLLRFSQAMFSPNFLPKELMEQIFTPYNNEKDGINNYGLGFRMKVYDNGKKLTYHNGWWHGSNTVFIHLPESRTTIIALSNKFTRRIYSAMALSSLFEDFPFDLNEIISVKGDGF